MIKRIANSFLCYVLLVVVVLSVILFAGPAGAQEDPEKPYVEERPSPAVECFEENGVMVCREDTYDVGEPEVVTETPVNVIDGEIVQWVYAETLPGVYFEGPLETYRMIMDYLETVRQINEFLEWHYRTYMKVWDDLAWCEARGNWSANTGNGYYGGLQMYANFWRSYGGLEYANRADQATREQQILVGINGRDARGGYGPWPSCARRLGLPR